MLWSRCIVSRHRRHTIFTTLRFNLIITPYLPNPPTLPTRCSSAAASQHRTHVPVEPLITPVNRTQDHPVIQPLPKDVPDQRKDVKSPWGREGTGNSRIQPEMVSMIDALFALWKKKRLDASAQSARDPGLLLRLRNRDMARELAVLIAGSAAPRRAYRVLLLAHEMGCTFKQNAYECTAHRLAECKAWNAIPAIVGIGQLHTGRTTVRLLNWRARAYVELSLFNKVDRVLVNFDREGLQPTRRTFHILIAGHIRNRNLVKARELLTLMERRGYPVDPSTHAIIIGAYRSLGPDKAVQSRALAALMNLGHQTGTMVLNSIIRQSLIANDLRGALQFLSFFGTVPAVEGEDSSGANSTLRDADFTPTHIRSSLKPSPHILTPDVTTFTMLINHMVKNRDLVPALQVTQRMQSAGIKPDDKFVAALIKTHIAAGDMSTALSLAASTCTEFPRAWELFIQLGLDPSDAGCPNLITTDVPPSIHVLNALLSGVQESHGLTGTKLIHGIMRVVGVVPDTNTLEILMSFLAKSNVLRPRDLIHLLRKLLPAIPPTLKHIHVILGAIVRKEAGLTRQRGWAAKAAGIRRVVPDDKVSDLPMKFDPLAGIDFSRKRQYRALLRPLIKSLTQRRIRADRATVALRLRHDAVVKADMVAATHTLQTMLDRGMHPNEYHYAALLQGHVQSGDMRAAEEFMESVVKQGVGPNVVMYTILIAGYASHGNAVRASKIFHAMVTAGIAPDVASIDALASAYFAIGAYTVARKVLLEMWNHVGPVPDGLESASLRQLAHTFRAMNQRSARKETSSSRSRRVLRWKLLSLARRFRADLQLQMTESRRIS